MFMVVLYRAGSERGWPLRRWLIAFVSSVVPFGTFVFDRSLRREIAEMSSGLRADDHLTSHRLCRE